MTNIKHITQIGHAATVDAAISQMENDVHQAFVVMDTDTGKILSYRQLMRNQKIKNWSGSSVNEFGRLENGVGGQIKNLTSTIAVIKRREIPHDRRKDVRYGQFVCNVRPKKKRDE